MRAIDYAKSGTPRWNSPAAPVKPSASLRLSAPVRPRFLAAASLLAALVLTGAAISYHQHLPVTNNDLAMLTTAANAGESGAELQLGLAWREGRLGLTADESRARYWIHRAALDGSAYAASLEGTAPAPGTLQKIGDFFAGIGAIFSRSAPQDLSAAAAAGDSVAQYQLAMRYRDGSWGVARDDAASRLWLERSAQGGNKVAMATLARAYDNGDHGFPRDPQQSRLWQERATASN